MATTGKQARVEVGRILNHEDKDTLLEVVNTGTSASQITDAFRLASTRFTSQTFQDRWVRHSEGAATPSGSLSYARTLTPTTGVLTVSPDFEAALASADDLEVWKINPDDVDRARDRALQNICTRWALTPLSELQDPDFLLNDVGDATPVPWVASSAAATVAEKTGLERFSRRVLRVLNSGANGYAGQTVNVHSSETYYFECLAQADVGTAQVTVQDLTNAVALTLSAAARTTWDGEAFNVISGTFTTSSTTEEISFRIGGSGASDDTYWANVCLQRMSRTEFVLPTRVLNATYVGEFFEVTGNDGGEQHLQTRWFQPRVLDVGGGQVKVIFPTAVGSMAVFYQEFSNYAPYQTGYNTPTLRRAGDVATQEIALEYAAFATLYEMFGDKYLKDWQRVHAKHGAKPYVRFQSPQYVSA
jgi:hypothetical protein